MVTKGCYLGPRPRLCSCDQPMVLVLIVARWLLHLQKEEGQKARVKGKRWLSLFPLVFGEATNVLEASPNHLLLVFYLPELKYGHLDLQRNLGRRFFFFFFFESGRIEALTEIRRLLVKKKNEYWLGT